MITRRQALAGLLAAWLPAWRRRHRKTTAWPGTAEGEGGVPVAVVNTGIFNSPFTLGATQPDASSTGYGVLGYNPSTLVDQPQGDLIITTDGTVVQGLRIHGMVQINANNCTVQGCHIVSFVEHPYPGTSHYGLVSSGGTGNTIAYNEITLWDSFDGTDNSGYTPVGGVIPYWPVGVLLTGGSNTVYRNNIHDVNDCVYINGGSGHRVQGNYIHDPMFRTDDNDQAGSTPPKWSHNDGVQFLGGIGHVVDGNSFEMKFSSQTGMPLTANPNPLPAEQAWLNCHGVLVQSSNSQISGLQITRNWFKYASAPIRYVSGAFDPGGTVTVTFNRFTPDQGKEFSQYVQVRDDPTTSWPSVTFDNTNVYSADSDTPLAVQGLPLNGNPAGNPFTAGTTKIWALNSSAHTP